MKCKCARGNTRAERNLRQGMILGKDSQGGGYVIRAILACSDIFSLNDLADSVKEKCSFAVKSLRIHQDGHAAARRIRLSIGRLRVLLPFNRHARDAEAAQQRGDILRALLSESGLFDETLSVG